jgi:hypothetical protein
VFNVIVIVLECCHPSLHFFIRSVRFFETKEVIVIGSQSEKTISEKVIPLIKRVEDGVSFLLGSIPSAHTVVKGFAKKSDWVSRSSSYLKKVGAYSRVGCVRMQEYWGVVV